MSKLSDEVIALATGLSKKAQVDIRVNARAGVNGPDWHTIVWDGQIGEDPDTGLPDYNGLQVLAAASGMNMTDVLEKVRDILKQRTENN